MTRPSTTLLLSVPAMLLIAVFPVSAETIELRSGGNTSITARGGDIVTVDVFVDELETNMGELPVVEYRATLPCSATAGMGATGSVNFVDTMANPSPIIDDVRSDYFFSDETSNDTITEDSGSCPSSTLADFPFAQSLVPFGNDHGTSSGTDLYLGTFRFEVSTNAEGTFTLTSQAGTACDADGTYLLEDMNPTDSCRTITLGTLTIEVPTGRCCVDSGCDQTCTADVTEYHCEETLEGVFYADEDCTSSCPCHASEHCHDGDDCTRDVCSSGTCSNPSGAVFGDLVGATRDECGGNGQVQTADILAVNDAFGGTYACDLCDPDGDDCSSSLAASTAAAIANAARSGQFSIVPLQRRHVAGEVHFFDVYARVFENSGNYAFTAQISGGDTGALLLEVLQVDQLRKDYLFHNEGTILITDVAGANISSIVIDESVKKTTDRPAYLGTLGLRTSKDAAGTFDITLVAAGGVVLATKSIDVR